MSEHWSQCLHTSWGIKAQLTALDGELDLNFKAEESDGSCYILKVMRPGCSKDLVAMQCAALMHIHASVEKGLSPEVSVPTIVQSIGDQYFKVLDDEAGQARLVWVLSYIEGTNYAHFSPKSSDLITHLGNSMARLHVSLEEFQHNSLRRDFKWNLLQASWIENKLSIVSDSHRRELLRSVMVT